MTLGAECDSRSKMNNWRSIMDDSRSIRDNYRSIMDNSRSINVVRMMIVSNTTIWSKTY